MLKLEFLHFAHPELILRSVFASVFAVFLAKNATAAGLPCTKRAELSISRRFFSVFQCVSHFASVFTVFLLTPDFLHMSHASLDLHLYVSSVRGCGGMRGG